MKRPNLTIKNHLPFTLKGFGDVDPLPTLKRTLDLLAGTDLRRCLSAGTALGIHRDKGFIPHDTDLDLAIELPWEGDWYPLTLELVRRFSRENIPLVRSIVLGQRPIQLVFADALHDRVLIDVEFYYVGLLKEKTVHYKPEGRIVLPLFGVAPYAFRGLTVPMPHPIDDYLESRYGDWETKTKEKGAWQAYTRAFTAWTP